MIQSRAQFGYVGASVPLVLVLLMYLGYGSMGGVLSGQAVASLTGLDLGWSIVGTIAAAAALAVVGYRLLHAVATVLTVVVGVALLVLTVGLLVRYPLSEVALTGGFSWAPFLLAASLSATAQLTYAPYVADYSRYLPAGVSTRRTFWATYLGTVTALTWMFAFGAVAASVDPTAFADGSVDFVAGAAGFAAPMFLLILCVGTTATNALAFYGLFMSWTTLMTTFTRARITARIRAGVIGVAAVLSGVVALAGQEDFLVYVTNLVLFLGFFLIPWTSINLVDFYLVRRERYDIAAIFDPRGRYAGVDWRAMTAYGIGVAAELPLLHTAVFTGPLVPALGGADVSWLVGVVVPALAYWAIMRAFPVRHGVRADAEVGTLVSTDSIAVPTAAVE
jgi:NCS1 family nucleobase:cation symporter-1